MKIEVDLDRCTGTANCVAAAPDFFDIGEDEDQVVLLTAVVPQGRLAEVENAVRMCPQGALKLVP